MRYLAIVLFMLVSVPLFNGCHHDGDDSLEYVVSNGSFFVYEDKDYVQLPADLTRGLKAFLVFEKMGIDKSVPVPADGGVQVVVRLAGEKATVIFVSAAYWTSDRDSRMWRTNNKLPMDVYSRLIEFSASLVAPENRLEPVEGPE